MMKRTIGIVILSLAGLWMFTGCGTTVNRVRNAWEKISAKSTKDNFAKFEDSSFKNYFMYKNSLKSDFDLAYFTSYYYSSYGTTIQVRSSRLFTGDNVVALGNIFSNAYVKNDSRVSATSYLLMREGLITKTLTMVMNFNMAEVKTGHYRGTGSSPVVDVVLKDEKGKTLFDLSDPKCYLAVEVLSTDSRFIEGKFTGRLIGRKKAVFLDIREGEFWIKKQP